MTNLKYKARVHAHPDTVRVKFIGTVVSQTIPALKVTARALARAWNHHPCKLHIQCENTNREWTIKCN